MKDTILIGHVLEKLREIPDEHVDCIVTSPPYWQQRDYRIKEDVVWADGLNCHLGNEPSPQEYIDHLMLIFKDMIRVLKPSGTIFLVLGDTYSTNLGGNRNGTHNKTWKNAECEQKRSEKIGHKPLRKRLKNVKIKTLLMIPSQIAIMLVYDLGLILRSSIIWNKPNCMPESTTDRPTSAYENIYMLSKKPKYYANMDSVRQPHKQVSIKRTKYGWNGHREPGTKYANVDHRRTCNPKGRNIRNVWNINTKPYKGSHFATFPPELVRRCLKIGCPKGGIVLDPFAGSGTTAEVAVEQGCHYVLIDINDDYLPLMKERIEKQENKI